VLGGTKSAIRLVTSLDWVTGPVNFNGRIRIKVC